MVNSGPMIRLYRDAVNIMIEEIESPDVFVPMVDDVVKDDTAFLGQLIMKLMHVTDSLNTQYKDLLKKYEKLKNKRKKLRADKNSRNDKVIQEKTDLKREKKKAIVAKGRTKLERKKVEKQKPPELQHNSVDLIEKVKSKRKIVSKVSKKPSEISRQKGQSKNTKLSCDICQTTYTTETSFKRHLKYTDHTNVIYKCKICMKRFWHRDVFNKHEKKNEGLAYPCDECEKMYHSKVSLRRHKNIFHKGITYKCSICKKIFTLSSGLSTHRKVVHEGQNANFSCNFCHRSFSYKFNMQRHLLRCKFNNENNSKIAN